jgi:predicted DNA-binding transcriptional regulator AlpA
MRPETGVQLPLPIPASDSSPRAGRRRTKRIAPAKRPGLRSEIDQVLSTRDIVRITGRHRCTIYRWVRDGTFPAKRAGAGRGWLRSDVERWLQGGPSE